VKKVSQIQATLLAKLSMFQRLLFLQWCLCKQIAVSLIDGNFNMKVSNLQLPRRLYQKMPAIFQGGY
jgi:hypothetical protein